MIVYSLADFRMHCSYNLHRAITRSEDNMRRFMILTRNVVDQFIYIVWLMIMLLLSLYFKAGNILINHHRYKIPWSYFWSKNYHIYENPVPLSVRYPWSYMHDTFHLQTCHSSGIERMMIIRIYSFENPFWSSGWGIRWSSLFKVLIRAPKSITNIEKGLDK